MVRMGEVKPAAFKLAESLILDHFKDKEAEGPFKNSMNAEHHDPRVDAMFEFDWRETARANLLSREQELQEIENKKPLNVFLNSLASFVSYWYTKIWPSVSFDFFLGDPVLANSFFIVFIIMFHKRLRVDVLFLIISFQYCINPLYVVLAILVYRNYICKPRVPKNYKPIKKRNTDDLPKDVRESMEFLSNLNRDSASHGCSDQDLQKICDEINKAAFDHILVGSDFSTLYTAALLAKCGHRCCVLAVKQGRQTKIFPKGSPSPVLIVDPCFSRLGQYQNLLDIVIPDSASSKRVLLKQFGSSRSGYTHTVLCWSDTVAPVSVPEDAAAEVERIMIAGNVSELKKEENHMKHTFCLRAGENSLLDDLISDHGVDKTITSKILSDLMFICEMISMYLTTKVGYFEPKPQVVADQKSGSSLLQQILKCAEFANMNFERFINSLPNEDTSTFNVLARLFTGIAGYDLYNPSDVSMIQIASTLAPVSRQGAFGPRDGIDSLSQMLAATITENGGVVIHGISYIKGFLAEQLKLDHTSGSKSAEDIHSGKVKASTRIVGVLVKAADKVNVIRADRSIVSGLGAISTYKQVCMPIIQKEANGDGPPKLMNMVPTSIEKSLSKLQESAPKVQCIFWLDAEEISNEFREQLSCNYIELLDPGEFKDTFSCGSYKIWSPTARDRFASSPSSSASNLVVIIVEALAGSDLVSPATLGSGLRVYQLHPNSCRDPQVPNIMRNGFSQLNNNLEKALRLKAFGLLNKVHPCVTEALVKHFTAILSPLGGYSIANTGAKYEGDIKSRTEFANLFLCGVDVGTAGLAGDLQGGWVAANAVLGDAFALKMFLCRATYRYDPQLSRCIITWKTCCS